MDAFLGFLLDQLTPIYRECFEALAALKTHGMNEEFQLIPSCTIRIGEIHLSGDTTSYKAGVRASIISRRATGAGYGKTLFVKPR